MRRLLIYQIWDMLEGDRKMANAKRQTQPQIFEVVVSFDGLNKGEQFTQPPEDLGWALRHVESGYLRVVPQEETPDAGEVGQG